MNLCKCGLPAVVQWQRRPTPAEVDQVAAVEATRRSSTARKDQRPEAPPQPTAENITLAVYACADHAISPDLASRVHLASCSGLVKNSACDCTPEPPHDQFPGPGSQRRLPPGW